MERGGCLLFLEPVRPVRRWPWRETEAAAQVLERLALFHTARVDEGSVPPLWDYEAELAASARQTLALLDALPEKGDLRPLRRRLPALRRVVAALPEMRRHLLELERLPWTVIHGDVHPGNAMIRLRSSREHPVLLDWGRARIGSPLEDVSSWLQSLGFWEPQARRRHDTLLVRYLEARGLPPRLDRELRDAYWMAGASNALAGALAYHLWRLEQAAPESIERGAALDAVRDALRVIRRADTCWCQAPERRRPPAQEPLPLPPG
jgi:Ser/Thr protein kinase RdoA (MazF antagonist)